MKYEVNFTDYNTGATSAIDTVIGPENYTADQYIRDCKENAEDEWNDMLEMGEVTLIAIDEVPTVKEIIQSTGMTQTAFAKKFCIPLRTVQDWCGGRRQCSDYIIKMIENILENEKEEEENHFKLQFEAGDGVNFLKGENKYLSIYAECKVPEDASEDYGYITMKNAVLSMLAVDERKVVTFWYDGQENNLSEDARANVEVVVRIETSDGEFTERSFSGLSILKVGGNMK